MRNATDTTEHRGWWPDRLYTVIVLGLAWGSVGLAVMGGANPPSHYGLMPVLFSAPFVLVLAAVVGVALPRTRPVVYPALVWAPLVVLHALLGTAVLMLHWSSPATYHQWPPGSGSIARDDLPGFLGLVWADDCWEYIALVIWFPALLFAVSSVVRGVLAAYRATVRRRQTSESLHGE